MKRITFEGRNPQAVKISENHFCSPTRIPLLGRTFHHMKFFFLAACLPLVGCSDGRHVIGLVEAAEFLPGERLGYEVGKEYSWEILLKKETETIEVQEIFTLPAVPATWGSEPSGGYQRVISADSKTCTTTWLAQPEGGRWIRGKYTIAEGDPLGAYQIEVRMNNQSVKKFRFEIVTPRLDFELTKIEKKPNEGESYYMRGYVAAFEFDRKKAQESFEKGISLDPKNPRLRLGYGFGLFLMKDYSGALQQWQKHAEMPNRDEYRVYYTLALGEWRTGNYAKAIHYYQNAVEKDPRFGTKKTLLERIDKWHPEEQQAIMEIFTRWRYLYSKQASI